MEKKYRIDTDENKEFLKAIREDLLRFGHKFPSEEGSSYYLGEDGTPWKERPRETWITSRMAHVYSIGALLGHPGSRELAAAAVKGLTGELADKEHGGWYAGVIDDMENDLEPADKENDGWNPGVIDNVENSVEPADKEHGDSYPEITLEKKVLPGKQCYAHAFVILAASSAFLIQCPGAKELLQEALAVYDRYFWDEGDGLACDTWNTQFTDLEDYRGLNANMHTVEAFLAASDVTGDETYRKRAGRIIDHVIAWASGNDWRIPEHFTKEWQADLEFNREQPADPFKPYGATPGHGIEWARLICQWALSTYGQNSDAIILPNALKSSVELSPNDQNLKMAIPYIEAAENLYNRAVSDGWDVDGAPGFVYTTDWEGKPVVHDRMHWTLAEAINTSAVLFQITKKEKYAEDYGRFLAYLDDKMLDRKNGSWFHQLDQNNQVIDTVWPGKPDIYHALQSTLIPYLPTDTSIAPAVAGRSRGGA